MSDMLAMAAIQIRDPIALFILMITNYFALHHEISQINFISLNQHAQHFSLGLNNPIFH
jgi:hypothetical protein